MNTFSSYTEMVRNMQEQAARMAKAQQQQAEALQKHAPATMNDLHALTKRVYELEQWRDACKGVLADRITRLEDLQPTYDKRLNALGDWLTMLDKSVAGAWEDIRAIKQTRELAKPKGKPGIMKRFFRLSMYGLALYGLSQVPGIARGVGSVKDWATAITASNWDVGRACVGCEYATYDKEEAICRQCGTNLEAFVVRKVGPRLGATKTWERRPLKAEAPKEVAATPAPKS